MFNKVSTTIQFLITLLPETPVEVQEQIIETIRHSNPDKIQKGKSEHFPFGSLKVTSSS